MSIIKSCFIFHKDQDIHMKLNPRKCSSQKKKILPSSRNNSCERIIISNPFLNKNSQGINPREMHLSMTSMYQKSLSNGARI